MPVTNIKAITTGNTLLFFTWFMKIFIINNKNCYKLVKSCNYYTINKFYD